MQSPCIDSPFRSLAAEFPPQHACVGLRFLVKRGSDLFRLHVDYLGSTLLTTDRAGAATARRVHCGYCAMRVATGDLRTDCAFTGLQSDTGGLMYCNARSYAQQYQGAHEASMDS